MLAARMGGKAYIQAMVSGDKKKGTDNHSLTMKIADLDSRDTAKTTMYCLLFGGGDAKLAKSAKKPVGSGPDIRNKLYKGLDGLEELMEKLTKEWKETAKQRYNPKFNRMEYYDGKITGLDGRPIIVPSEHMLLVYLLQSDEAVMMSKAFNLANQRLSEKYKYGVDFGFLCWLATGRASRTIDARPVKIGWVKGLTPLHRPVRKHWPPCGHPRNGLAREYFGEGKVSASSILSRSKRPAAQVRKVNALGRTYRDVAYRPQFAIGILCKDEADQIRLHHRLLRHVGKRDLKVLVI
jgi:hypothetical protein